MFRKTLLAIAAVAALGSIATSTSASAYWRGGYGGGWRGGFGGGYGFGGGFYRPRGFGFYGAPAYGYYGGCVRRVWTPYGWRLRRVCY